MRLEQNAEDHLLNPEFCHLNINQKIDPSIVNNRMYHLRRTIIILNSSTKFVKHFTCHKYSTVVGEHLDNARLKVLQQRYIEEASVYVHWPYCKKLCTYCNFVKYVPKKNASWNIDQDLFIDALVSE